MSCIKYLPTYFFELERNERRFGFGFYCSKTRDVHCVFIQLSFLNSLKEFLMFNYFFAKFCLNFLCFVQLLFEKVEKLKSIFQPAFGVHSIQTLVKIYNKVTEYCTFCYTLVSFFTFDFEQFLKIFENF